MSLFNKAGLLVGASLFVTASAFAQSNNCCPPKPKCCEEMKQIQLMAGYNAPSRIEVRGCWDVYASGSFTYWQPFQSNMELGSVNTNLSLNETHKHIVNQKFGYKPGFKVALGMNFDHDNWDSMVQYTWFRGSDSTTTNLDQSNLLVENFVAFDGSDAFENLQTIYQASQTWKLHMDTIDWDLGRSYYVGTKLTFRPSLGARAAWIRQNLRSENSGFNLDLVSFTDALSKRSYAWGVGPRAMVNTNWAIGEGFRLFGNGGADILFTQYTKLKIRSESPDLLGNTGITVVSQKSLNTLRPHLDLELGLGWGSYFDCNNWHVDLTAGYGFQVYFDQNMFRPYIDSLLGKSPQGNLYIHGLTATARFDF